MRMIPSLVALALVPAVASAQVLGCSPSFCHSVTATMVAYTGTNIVAMGTTTILPDFFTSPTNYAQLHLRYQMNGQTFSQFVFDAHAHEEIPNGTLMWSVILSPTFMGQMPTLQWMAETLNGERTWTALAVPVPSTPDSVHVTPEPGSLGLLAVPLLGLALWRRRVAASPHARPRTMA